MTLTLTLPPKVTERAFARLAEINEDAEQAQALRVAVEGGGCSGFQYSFDIVHDRAPDDLVIEKAGAVVLVDTVSQEYMPGAEIDFSDELIGAAFKINNPLATASCGCGTSFSI